MLILGIETSCDDTAAAVVKSGSTSLSNIVYTQLIHAKYGGIVPEIASRGHIKHLNIVVRTALARAHVDIHAIDGVAVTCGPGLIGSLLVGVSFAKSLAWSMNIPLLGVNHLEGHIFACLLSGRKVTFPFVSLIVSGGHSEIVLVQDYFTYQVLGRTRDDAAGEAFDKVAKIVGLPYPGGPSVEKAARDGDPSYVQFPRAYIDPESLDFSFSGLKTAFRNYAMDHSDALTGECRRDVLASFQEAVIEVLLRKTMYAAKKARASHIVLGGGVARNTRLRTAFHDAGKREKIEIIIPAAELCTDNAAMIAAIAHYRYEGNLVSSPLDLDACPNLTL
jgi:N6-L-threonylcarbamoyladenine synthase